jgi:hypothetical protein
MVFGSQSRVKQLFTNRFEPDGEGFLFRANIRAAGIPVSASERDRFVAEFGRGILIATWTTAGFIVLLIVGFVLVATANVGNLPEFAAYLLVAVCMLPFLAAFHWLWNAPVRALSARAPATAERSKTEARRLAFQRMTWSQLGLAAVMVPVILLRVGSRHSLLVGWNRARLLIAGLFLIFVGVQAVRKWRASRTGPSNAG